MNRKIGMPLVLAALACAAAPFAVTQASAKNADARAQLARLDLPLGDMACTGQTMATDKRPGYATRAHLRIEDDLEGYWIAIHYDEEKTAENAHPYHVVQYIGFDEKSKRFDSVTIDSSGAGATLGTSTGWEGGAMTVEEHVSDGAYRDVFTRNADGVAHAGSLKAKDGKWIETDRETCRKPMP
jgi:hypothetical protein